MLRSPIEPSTTGSAPYNVRMGSKKDIPAEGNGDSPYDAALPVVPGTVGVQRGLFALLRSASADNWVKTRHRLMEATEHLEQARYEMSCSMVTKGCRTGDRLKKRKST